MRVRHELPRNWWFLPNGDFMIFWYIGSREDIISSRENHFYDFCSLSSLITLSCQRFAYVARHLMRIETIINTPLELPLPNHRSSTIYISFREKAIITFGINKTKGKYFTISYFNNIRHIIKPNAWKEIVSRYIYTSSK